MTSRTNASHILPTLATMVVLLGVGGPLTAHALVADLGSDGSDGPLNITADTVLPLPPNGVLHATTVNIASGATLSFSFPGSLHPGVILLATGDIVIDGTIDVRGGVSTAGTVGAAGPGGTPGGAPVAETSQIHGLRLADFVPGGGGDRDIGVRPIGGRGGRGTRCLASGVTALGAGGGGGGGAILIASNTRISGSGTVNASGGAAGSAVPTPCATVSAASDGLDGRVRLMTPTADLAGATLVAQSARLDAWERLGVPVTVTGTSPTTRFALGASLARVPTPFPQPTIVAVDGAAVAPGSLVSLPGGSTGATITVHVDDCTRGPMTARVYAQSLERGHCDCGIQEAVVSAPTGSDDVDLPFLFSSCACGGTRDNAFLFPVVFCGPNSAP